MSKQRVYITTAIPYVNGAPHLGHALELVQGDVLARAARARGDDVRFLSGTDDHALKNVAAAETAGVPLAAFIEKNARRFLDLHGALDVECDDVIQTSVDPRHRPGVERLWRACAAAGDLYEREYEGLYCPGCEAFVDGPCEEHPGAPEPVGERNWFFRLARYRDALVELVGSGRLRIEPERRRNEVLSLLRGGLDDLSVSRPTARARGWGIPVPGDPSQTVYVWFDALANYVTALDYGTAGAAYDRWWVGADERIHLIGKGILRFHAVYWPAILLSAGEPAPTTLFVHDYVTARGAKISKSAAPAADPARLAQTVGADALRWWLLRDGPHTRDAEFTHDALAARANELADGLGNLVARTVTLVDRLRPGLAPPPATDDLAARTWAAVAAFDFRAAAAIVAEAVDEANALASRERPWELRAEDPTVDRVLAELLVRSSNVARAIEPLLPAASARVGTALAALDRDASRALFRKVA